MPSPTPAPLPPQEPMRGIIPWFARNAVAANLLMLIVIVLGVLSAGSLRKESFPSLEPDTLTISVSYDSGSARQSEEGLAIKIEEQLEDVTGIDTITSSSTSNGATVTVEMQEGYELETLLRDVKAKVDAISNFPTDADKPVIEKAEREEHALMLQLYGDTDRHTLQQLADELKSDLLANPKVNRVSISGWLDPMISIEIDEGQLQAFGLSLSDVEEAVNQESSSTAAATLRNANSYLQLKASEQAYNFEDFAKLPLKTFEDGSQILLGDVARVTDGFDDDTAVLSRFNGANSISLQVITTGTDDIADTVDGAKKVVEEWRGSGKLPQGVHLTSWYDRSTMIKGRLKLLGKNAFMGIVMVFFLLALFLNLTVGFWVAMGLPFIFFGTLYLMGDAFAGLSLNEFTTFGFIIALGIVVDDAVVIGESVYTLRSKEGDTLENTVRGTLRVAVPTMFGVLTTVAAFYAISCTRGHMGQIYSQFAIVVSICLLLSLVESKLILPAHLAHLNTRPHKPKFFVMRAWAFCQRMADAGLGWFNNQLYRRAIAWSLRYRYAVAVGFIAILVFVGTMPFTGLLRMSFFPDVTGDTVRASLIMRNDVSYGQTHAALSRLEALAYDTDKALRGDAHDSGIKYLQVSSSADRSGSLRVQLAENAPYGLPEFAKAWRQAAGLPEGVRTLSIQSRHEMVDALRVELRANSEETLSAAGAALKEALQKIPAVSGIEDNLSPSQPQLLLRLTRQGRAMGVTMDMLAGQMLQAFKGRVVQRFQRDNDEIEVRVRYPEDQRGNAADVLAGNIRTEGGTVVPLSTVATATYGYTRDTVTRIGGKRAVYLSADVDKDLMSSTELVNMLSTEIAPQLTRTYPSLDIHFAGEAEEQAETENSMLQMFLMALLLIYVLLAVPLKSYVQPLLIMTAIPFGIVGAMLGHWVSGIALGILSLNGIIALAGVVVNDSLLLVDTFNEMRNPDTPIEETLSLVGRSRLRAVLLTSFTTYAGLVPLLGETERQAQFLIPAAVSLGYGILFATGITLILIPVLLMIREDVSRGWARLAGLFRTEHAEQPMAAPMPERG